MVTLAPEPLASRGTCFVAAFSWEISCFFFAGVLGASFVEDGEVDAEAASSGVLRDDHTIGEPSGMDNFFDDASFSGAWRRAF